MRKNIKILFNQKVHNLFKYMQLFSRDADSIPIQFHSLIDDEFWYAIWLFSQVKGGFLFTQKK